MFIGEEYEKAKNVGIHLSARSIAPLLREEMKILKKNRTFGKDQKITVSKFQRTVKVKITDASLVLEQANGGYGVHDSIVHHYRNMLTPIVSRYFYDNSDITTGYFDTNCYFSLAFARKVIDDNGNEKKIEIVYCL